MIRRSPVLRYIRYIVIILISRQIYIRNKIYCFWRGKIFCPQCGINFHEGIMRESNAKICSTGSQEIIFYSQLPPQDLGALPSLNPSDDSHERSREAGRNARRVGAAKCTRANVSLPLYARAPVLCPVITTSKLRGPFNERGGITPRPLYQPSPGDGRAIYKRFHALSSLAIFPPWRRLM